MNQKLVHLFLPAFFLALAFSACSRYGDDVTTSETDVVATFRDGNTDFTTLGKKFAIVDKINIADEDGTIDSIQFWNRYNDPVLGAIVTNLTNLGYTEVSTNENPAVFINVTANANVTKGGGSTGWWWGYYPCNPYYYWWCYGGWYPGGVYYYEFTEGSLVIEMVDLNRSMDNERPTIVWFAGLTGVLNDNPATNVDRAVKNTNQAFKQSPYLR